MRRTLRLIGSQLVLLAILLQGFAPAMAAQSMAASAHALALQDFCIHGVDPAEPGPRGSTDQQTGHKNHSDPCAFCPACSPGHSALAGKPIALPLPRTAAVPMQGPAPQHFSCNPHQSVPQARAPPAATLT